MLRFCLLTKTEKAASHYTQGEALPCLRSGFLEAGGSDDCLKKDTEKARRCAAKAGNSLRTFGPDTGFWVFFGMSLARMLFSVGCISFFMSSPFHTVKSF